MVFCRSERQETGNGDVFHEPQFKDANPEESLIRQEAADEMAQILLNPEDKIMVTEKPRATIQFLQQGQGFDEMGEVWRSGWSATIIKADLNAYKRISNSS